MKLNSVKFWNDKISNPHSLLNSRIYRHKNLILIYELLFRRGKYLDIGFGYGVIQKYISILNKKIDLYGIDISNSAVKNIKNKINGDFRISTTTHIPFPKNYFEIISALDVLEHLNDSDFNMALNQIYSRLKIDGTLYLSFPINESLEDTLKNHHLQKINIPELTRKLIAIGFKIKKTYQLTAYPNMYLLKYIINRFLNISKPNLIILVCKK